MFGCEAEGRQNKALLQRCLSKQAYLKGYSSGRLVHKYDGANAHYEKAVPKKTPRVAKHARPMKLQPLQAGNHIARENFKPLQTIPLTKRFQMLAANIRKKEWVPHLDPYWAEIKEVQTKYYPQFQPDVIAELEEVIGETRMAVNFINCYTSRLANHKDPKAALPAILTMCKPLEAKSPFTGGELLLTPLGFTVDYGEKDIVVFRGDLISHAVLPLVPDEGIKDPVRVSCIHYNRWKTKAESPGMPRSLRSKSR